MLREGARLGQMSRRSALVCRCKIGAADDDQNPGGDAVCFIAVGDLPPRLPKGGVVGLGLYWGAGLDRADLGLQQAESPAYLRVAQVAKDRFGGDVSNRLVAGDCLSHRVRVSVPASGRRQGAAIDL